MGGRETIKGQPHGNQGIIKQGREGTWHGGRRSGGRRGRCNILPPKSTKPFENIAKFYGNFIINHDGRVIHVQINGQ